MIEFQMISYTIFNACKLHIWKKTIILLLIICLALLIRNFIVLVGKRQCMQLDQALALSLWDNLFYELLFYFNRQRWTYFKFVLSFC